MKILQKFYVQVWGRQTFKLVEFKIGTILQYGFFLAEERERETFSSIIKKLQIEPQW